MQKGTVSETLCAGTIAGIIGMTFVYPLDTLLVRIQYDSKSNPNLRKEIGVRDIPQLLRGMVQKEGFLSLYRGVLAPQVGFGVTFSITFTAYGYASNYFLMQKSNKASDNGEKNAKLSIGELMLCGGFAGLMNAAPRQVFERVKSVMQVRTKEATSNTRNRVVSPYKSSIHCAIELVRTQGVYRGLFHGLGACTIREIPQFAIYYPAYEITLQSLLSLDKRYSSRGQGEGGAIILDNKKKQQEIPTSTLNIYRLLAGGLAGTVQWLPPVYFLDVIKSKMQASQPGEYKNTYDCVVKTYRSEGMRAFFRGFNVALLRAFPLHAILFLGYEYTMQYLISKRLGSDT